MAESKQKVTNKKQFELMVGILEANPEVAKGLTFVDCTNLGRGTYNDVWSDITATLNSAGPPTRKTAQWQKVWSDLKTKVKKKLQHNKAEVKATGGGPNRLKILSTYEETVVSLMSFDKTTNHEGPSFGLNTPSPRSESSSSRPGTLSSRPGPPSSRPGTSSSRPGPPSSRPGTSSSWPGPPSSRLETPSSRSGPPSSRPGTPSSMPGTSEDSSDDTDEDLGRVGSGPVDVPPTRTPVTSRRPTPKNYRQKLLEAQTNYLRELVDNSRESVQLQREQLELQKVKLKLKKETLIRAEKQRAEELQFQMQVLEYKRRKLDMRREYSEL